MTDQATAYSILRRGDWKTATDSCLLDYEQRFLRRKVVETTSGKRFLANLNKTTSLDDGDAFELDDGGLVSIHAAAEPLLRVTGARMARLSRRVAVADMP